MLPNYSVPLSLGLAVAVNFGPTLARLPGGEAAAPLNFSGPMGSAASDAVMSGAAAASGVATPWLAAIS